MGEERGVEEKRREGESACVLELQPPRLNRGDLVLPAGEGREEGEEKEERRSTPSFEMIQLSHDFVNQERVVRSLSAASGTVFHRRKRTRGREGEEEGREESVPAFRRGDNFDTHLTRGKLFDLFLQPLRQPSQHRRAARQQDVSIQVSSYIFCTSMLVAFLHLRRWKRGERGKNKKGEGKKDI